MIFHKSILKPIRRVSLVLLFLLIYLNGNRILAYDNEIKLKFGIEASMFDIHKLNNNFMKEYSSACLAVLKDKDFTAKNILSQNDEKEIKQLTESYDRKSDCTLFSLMGFYGEFKFLPFLGFRISFPGLSRKQAVLSNENEVNRFSVLYTHLNPSIRFYFPKLLGWDLGDHDLSVFLEFCLNKVFLIGRIYKSNMDIDQKIDQSKKTRKCLNKEYFGTAIGLLYETSNRLGVGIKLDWGWTKLLNKKLFCEDITSIIDDTNIENLTNRIKDPQKIANKMKKSKFRSFSIYCSWSFLSI